MISCVNYTVILLTIFQQFLDRVQIQYFGNFLAEIFEHDGFKEGVIYEFSLDCSFSICILYEDK